MTAPKRARHGAPVQQRPISWKLIIIAALALSVLGSALGWFWLHAFSVRDSIDSGVVVLRDAGPWVFFGAVALLPAIGFPIMVFHLTAGTAFAGQLGLGGVIAATGVALAINLSLTYWLARYALRPFIEEMISRTKYRIPTLAPDEHAEITLLIRITPGPPYFVQSYLLGLAGVRFGTYLWISWVVSIAYASGFIVFGDAILHGKARMAVIGFSAIVAVALIVHFVRRHYGKKRT
ncbi:MAG TPA: VTT domain-containing protein [Candidatus Didemnitutus sp.]|nr:VTT domain-containing protein [Candidatus Didemnitutus sp.]